MKKSVSALFLFLVLGTELLAMAHNRTSLPQDVYSKMAASLINIATKEKKEIISDEIISYLKERVGVAQVLLNGEGTSEIATLEIRELNSDIALANLKKNDQKWAHTYNQTYNNKESGAQIRKQMENAPCALGYISYLFSSMINKIVIIAMYEQIQSYHDHTLVANFKRQYGYEPFSKQGLIFPCIALQQDNVNNYPQIISYEDFYFFVSQDNGQHFKTQTLLESAMLALTILNQIISLESAPEPEKVI